MSAKAFIGAIIAGLIGLFALLFVTKKNTENSQPGGQPAAGGSSTQQPSNGTPSPSPSSGPVPSDAPVKNPVQELISKILDAQPNPELRTIEDWQTQALIKANAKRTYNIIADATSKIFNADSGPHHDPEIIDMDGFNDVGTGAGIMINGVASKGVTYNGKTYSSYLDYTKKTYGRMPDDPLGLKGDIARTKEKTGSEPFYVNYTWKTPTGISSQPGVAPTLNEWQTAYQVLTCTGIDQEITRLKQNINWRGQDDPIRKEGQTKIDYLEGLKKSKCSTQTNKTLYSGGTVINKPAPAVICEKGTDGNMHCRPK